MKKLKKFLIAFVITWVIVFVGSYALGLFENTFQYVVSPIILAFVGAIALSGNGNNKKTARSANSSSPRKTEKNSSIYVCQHLSTKILYEIKGNKVYKHLSSHVVYEIKGDKVYRALESKPILIIKDSKLYEPGVPTPKYRIDNNKIFEGPFGRTPILSLRSERDKFNSSK